MYRKHLYALLLACTIPTFASAVPIVWINEFHYDNVGSDSDEFIEIAGPAGTDLTGYSLVLYNGNGGGVDYIIGLSGILTDAAGGFGVLSVPSVGLQNGAPDGIALVNSSGVEQFLSYEGAFAATAGPAAGQTSIDIGVAQSGSPIGISLSLTGTGGAYSDFTWELLARTPGAPNTGQTFRAPDSHGVPDAASTAALLAATMLGIVGLSGRRTHRA